MAVNPTVQFETIKSGNSVNYKAVAAAATAAKHENTKAIKLKYYYNHSSGDSGRAGNVYMTDSMRDTLLTSK